MQISQGKLDQIKALNLVERREPNPYLKYGCHGDGVRADEKFVVKVYGKKDGRLSIVCNDMPTLERLLSGAPRKDYDVSFEIDDSGWGFPALGVLIGCVLRVKDEPPVMITREVATEFFQDPAFAQKKYLGETTRVIREMIDELTFRSDISEVPSEIGIKICTGFVFKDARNRLREDGYNVEVGEVKGLLQDDLELIHKEYVESKGFVYFDPKQFTGDDKSKLIANNFNDVVRRLDEMGLTETMRKTGWGFFKKRNPQAGSISVGPDR
jgi:hypothetical protein